MLGNLQVLVVGVVAWLVFGERPGRVDALALPIVLAGVVLISGVVGGGAYGANPPLGVVLGLATALCYSGYLLLIRLGGRDPRRPAGPWRSRRSSPRWSRRWSASSSATSTRAVAAEPRLAGVLGLTSQSIGYLCISISLPRLPAVVTSIILLVQPVITVGLSASCSTSIRRRPSCSASRWSSVGSRSRPSRWPGFATRPPPLRGQPAPPATDGGPAEVSPRRRRLPRPAGTGPGRDPRQERPVDAMLRHVVAPFVDVATGRVGWSLVSG